MKNLNRDLEIDICVLRSLIEYDENTGVLIWKERGPSLTGNESSIRLWNCKMSGKEAFTQNHNGYLRGKIFSKTYFSHRVAWAIFYGKWPDLYIDHINGIRSDNRIENLRQVQHCDNLRNCSIKSNNKSGVNGVLRLKDGRYRATIFHNGKNRQIGMYEDLESAALARREAQKLYGYHENHGRKKPGK